MAPPERVGLIYVAESDINQSIKEQVLGARLAADYSRENRPISAAGFELIKHPVTMDPSSVDEAARELVYKAGCKMLMGALTVPLSIRAAIWAEKERMLYLTSNNNPLVREDRRYVFHIGVPSEITGRAVANYLCAQGKSRAYILHTAQDFQKHATQCIARALVERKISAAYSEISEETGGDRELLERVRSWKPDVICIQASETERLAELVKTAHAMGGLPTMVHPHGLLCREFAELAGKAAEGHEFTDIYLRNGRAPAEEKALHRYLANVDPSTVATASHGFGWDCLRLLAATWLSAGTNVGRQVEFLEGLRGYSGATGLLTFSSHDHNGRWSHDPTTIARLVNGQFRVIDTLNRS